MKQMNFFAVAAIMTLSVGMSAQPQGTPPSPPKQRTPEEIAKRQAGRMKSELILTDKQYKKLYKLIKKDQQYRQSLREERFGDGMPPQGAGPGRMGGPGGMGGGMMGGGPGGMMGGGPGGMGEPGGGMMGGGRPPQGEVGSHERLVSEEYLDKQEDKLKKILTEEQYSKWRSKHPVTFEQPRNILD